MTTPHYAGSTRSSSHTTARASERKSSSTKTELVEEKRTDSAGVPVNLRWLKGKFLGKGGFAKCYAFTSMESNVVYAGKIVPKSALVKTRARQKLQTEIKIHKNLSHRNVVRFDHFFEDKHNAYIVLELCHNLTLTELVKRRRRLTEPEVQYYVTQLLDGVQYLHGRGVIHRDLKLGNLFLTRHMQLKIGDFGLAAKLSEPNERKRTICGTPNYIAPEILDGKQEGHSFEVDIWSIGVIIYTLVFGRPPYETTDVKATYRRIRENNYSFPEHVQASDAVKHLIRKILRRKPENRPSLAEIRAHPFLTRPSPPVSMPVSSLHAVPVLTPGEGQAPKRAAGEDAPRTRSSRRPLGAHNDGPAPRERAERVERADRATRYATGGERKVTEEENYENQAPAPAPRRSSRRPPMTARDPSPPPAVAAPQHKQRPASSTGSRSARNSHEGKLREFVAVPPAVATYDEAPPIITPRISPTVAGGPGPEPGPDDEQEIDLEALATAAPAPAAGAGVDVGAGAGVDVGEAKVDEETPAGATSPPETEKVPETEAEAEAGLGLTTPPTAAVCEGDGVATLRTMHRQLALSFAAADVAAEEAPEAVASSGQEPGLWVTRWVDYTSKYGLGFLLSNGSTGVYFNDSSKIILANDGEHFEYLERVRRPDRRSHGDVELQAHTLSAYPEALKKKVTLLKHFRNYLLEQSRKDGKPIQVTDCEADKTSALTYLKKWVRTRHAILFRLSNRTVQVTFLDNTELVLTAEAKVVTYVDKQGQRATFPLAAVVSTARPDISKRLKYTKDILHQLISGAQTRR